jgi:hypothetical protein
MPDANPIQPTYTFQNAYHQIPAKYTKVVLATAGFQATGSNANSIAFYPSASSAATVTLINGGTFYVPAGTAAAPNNIFELGVSKVDVGNVYLLY